MKLMIQYETSVQVTEDSFKRVVHRKLYPASTIIESAVKDFVIRFGIEREGNFLSGMQLSLCED